MTKKELVDKIIENFGIELYKKAKEFPNNKINLISFRKTPIKVRALILDNEREFHLIIDEYKNEIFHDCPSFLIHSNLDDKICIHIIKLLLSIDTYLSLKILTNLSRYSLTSEDFGSKKKSKNFIKLANICFENNNCVEGLNYLNKAIINQYDCEPIIERYFQNAIKNDLFIEFFEFLKIGFENELNSYFLKFNDYIERGFKLFLNSVSLYSFFDILRIIEYIDYVLEKYQFQSNSFISSILNKLSKMVKSNNFNERYFSIYFIKKNLPKLINFDSKFENLITQNDYQLFKEEIINYFLNEIENFCIIDKLKLMKKHFEVFEIPKIEYQEQYKNYKEEIRELERKVYLKKFAFLKLLIEQYNIKKSKVNFRKKRNTYVVNHDKENLENPAYNYVIKHVGFFGISESTIKSSEIGINYLIIKELFLDDFTIFPDIFYYKKQFWGENDNYKISLIEGFSVLSSQVNYNYEIDQNYSNMNEILIVEWDLASKPRQASLVNAYGSQIIIPDQNNPLFHDLKPFDLCYCKKTPIKMEGNIKTINVLTKCSFKEAINSISKGMLYIEGYYPLSLVNDVLKRRISPFKANELVINNPNKLFVPNYKQFIKAFREFLFEFINKEKDYIYNELVKDPQENINQLLILLNLTTELAGIDLPYTEIIKKALIQDIQLKELREKLINEIHLSIRQLLNKKELGSTKIFNLKKMRHTPFIQYSQEIIKLRKEELEKASIIKKIEDDTICYDFSEVNNTYYGIKFAKALNIGSRSKISQEILNKFSKFLSKLNIELNIIDQTS
ncbi:MAG: hypothetical protein ACFFA8_04465 [Promethearchaeota archaeon]